MRKKESEAWKKATVNSLMVFFANFAYFAIGAQGLPDMPQNINIMLTQLIHYGLNLYIINYTVGIRIPR